MSKKAQQSRSKTWKLNEANQEEYYVLGLKSLDLFLKQWNVLLPKAKI